MKNILLIITGSVGAVKSYDLIRLLKSDGRYDVRCILTKGAKNFVTPMSCSTLSGNKSYDELFSHEDEAEIGHISLAREADIVLVAPASADFIAKTANGLCDDLASTIYLATKAPVIFAPAMNTAMLEHPATRENINKLEEYGNYIIPTNEGKLACGEEGSGKMAEPEEIIEYMEKIIEAEERKSKPLFGLSAIVTSGPTRESIDPVRYISNYSSGKQGYAIAESLSKMGANVKLISGPTNLEKPESVELIKVESADEMLTECKHNVPVDIAICAAAVADWKPASRQSQKIKKQDNAQPQIFSFTQNPDILFELSKNSKNRPKLVIGFAAETEHLLENAMVKMERKNCDWIVANDVSGGEVFDSEENTVYIITHDQQVLIENKGKKDIANSLGEMIADFFSKGELSKRKTENKKSKENKLCLIK